MRTRPRRFLALLLPAALVLSFTSTPGTADTGPGQATGWRVSAEPFRLTFLDRGRPVTAEAPGAVAGPGGRLAYQVGGSASSQEGASYHRLTDLVSQREVPGGTAYTVATDEPDRTATVVVTRTREGLRVRWSFTPARTANGDVTLVFEAL